MRLDQFLVQFKKIESRTKAHDLIVHKQILVNGKIISKPSCDIDESDIVEIQSQEILKYVSRAGLKLEAAVSKYKLNLEGRIILDIGQSTGGFTDCCLQFGAEKVIGFDVGENQLHQSLRSDSKVIFFEKLNVKNLSGHTGFLKVVPTGGFNLLICDVSFISLSLVVPHISKYLKKNSEYLFLVKPQFECGSINLDKNGIVKNLKVYKEIQKNMTDLFSNYFGTVTDYFESPVPGKEGNLEFFIYGRNTK